MPLLRFAMLLSLLASVTACHRTGSAATMPDGSKIAILIASDRAFPPETAPERKAQLDQLLDWMDADLAELFDKIGYAAMPADAAADNAGPNRYLLRYQVLSYRSASRAAPMLSAGRSVSAQLTVQFELVDGHGAVVAADKPIIDGAPSWTHAGRALDKSIRDTVNGKLRLIH